MKSSLVSDAIPVSRTASHHSEQRLSRSNSRPQAAAFPSQLPLLKPGSVPLIPTLSFRLARPSEQPRDLFFAFRRMPYLQERSTETGPRGSPASQGFGNNSTASSVPGSGQSSAFDGRAHTDLAQLRGDFWASRRVELPRGFSGFAEQ